MAMAARVHGDARRNLHVVRCSGEALPFRGAAFDAVVCRFGVMFFADPREGAREALRVIGPGGALAFAVWSEKSANPFFSATSEVVSWYVPSEPEDPDAPGAWRFAPRGKLASLIEDVGLERVSERLLSFRIEAPLSFEEFWRMRVEMSDTLRGKVATLTDAQRAALARDAEGALARYFAAGTMSFPAEVLVVSGRKPV
jgi:SAM-dependent methyltransferase